MQKFRARMAAAVTLVAGGLLMSGTVARAQVLADRVPFDAIAYVGWQGTNSPGGGYDESRLKAVIESSKIRELVFDYVPRLVKRVSIKSPDDAQGIAGVNELIVPLIRYPSAVFFAGVTGEGVKTLPKIGILCQAGAEAPVLADKLDAIFAKVAKDNPFKLASRRAGDLVIVTIGYDDPATVGGPDRAAKLRQRDNFAAATTQVKAETSWITGYLDVPAMLDLIKKNIPDARNADVFTKIVNATGISGVKQFAFASGFDGRDWIDRSFIDAPAPRTGLVALCDGQAVSEATLRSIPADATFALAGRADFAKFVKETRVVVEKVDPEAAKMFDRGIGGLTIALGKQLVPDLLEPLGAEWAVYSSPTVGGTGLTGLVVANKLDDPAKFKASLPQASISLSNWLDVAMSKGGKKELTIAGQTTRVDGRNVYYLGLPVVQPSWTIAGDTLFLGLYTQSAIAGARYSTNADAKKLSILDNEKFIAFRSRLNVPKETSISYYDLPTSLSFGGGYQNLLVLSGYGGLSDMFGVPLAQPLLPPLDVLVKQTTPAGSASWADDRGFHTVALSPYPGSTLVSEQGIVSSFGAGGAALTTSTLATLLPSLNRARETANRVKCASNMRMIGQAILLYSNENKFKYPPDLGTLVKTQDITAQVFVCPSGETQLPPGLTVDQAAAWVNENAAYVYLGAGKTTSVPADEVILYEKPNAHDNDGMNILYGDGHVEFHQRADAQDIINKAIAPPGGGL